MQALCQITFQSCLIHFLGTFSTDHFSKLILIAKCSPQSLPYHSPTGNDPRLLPACYYSYYILVLPSTRGRKQSHPEMKTSSPTEMSHDRHDQGGIGRKWRQGCSTSSRREMQNIWHYCHPFHHHHL